MSVTPRPSLQHENSFHDHKIKQKNTEPGARPYQRSSRHLDRVPSATPKPPQKNETSLAHNCRALNQLSSQHYSEKPEAYYPWTSTLWWSCEDLPPYPHIINLQFPPPQLMSVYDYNQLLEALGSSEQVGGCHGHVYLGCVACGHMSMLCQTLSRTRVVLLWFYVNYFIIIFVVAQLCLLLSDLECLGRCD